MENSMKVPQKIKNRTTIWSSDSTSGYKSKGNKITISRRYLHPHVHCSIILNTCIQPKCPWMDKWMKKMWCIYTKWNITRPQKRAILPFATIWMNLEDTMLGEISQRKTDTIWSHVHVNSKKKKSQTYINRE